jgi:hypothetical protein
MKKTTAILTTMLIMLFAGSAMAAGTVTAADEKIFDHNGEWVFYRIVLTCTADAAAATYPDTTISSALSGVDESLDGMKLYKVFSVGNHGGTEPTNDTDLYLYIKAGTVAKAVDMLDGAGVDAIDNDANAVLYPAINGQAAEFIVFDDITIDIDNNAENSAVVYIEMIFKVL